MTLAATLLSVVLTGTLDTPEAPPSVEPVNVALAQELESFDSVGISPFPTQNIVRLLGEEDLVENLETLERLRTQLLAPSIGAGRCDLADWHRADFILRREIWVRQLVRALPADIDTSGELQIADLPNGNEWYRFLIYAWLGSDLEPDHLFQFGVQALEHLNSDRASFLDEAGPISSTSMLSPGDRETLEQYSIRQSQVRARMDSFYHHSMQVAPVQIRRSERGAAVRAPGFYRPNEQIFYYNQYDVQYDLKDADWLFLHEALPGHHYMMINIVENNQCSMALDPYVQGWGFHEGWATYSETLGEELGLYVDPRSMLAAFDWWRVRAARVAMDVGLNAYGWSDEEALDFWKLHVNEDVEAARNEIARLRRWPAQAHTYVLGADAISRARTRYVAQHGSAPEVIRNFHADLMSYGIAPLAYIDALYLPDPSDE